MNIKNYLPKLSLFAVLAQFILLSATGQVPDKYNYNLSGIVEINRGKLWYPVNDVIVLMESTGMNVNTGIDGSFTFPDIKAVYVSRRIIFTINNRTFDTIINRNLTAWTINVRPYRVRFTLSRIEATRDRDNDGVPDNVDNCPEVAGSAKYKGCPIPDRDGDGINDEEDHCPDLPGWAKYQGCPIPDSDGDGVNDEKDKCPEVRGLPRYYGCPIPDRDGDGVNDEEDHCRDVPGLAKYQGCPIPDSDGDGVNDEIDKCPEVAGLPRYQGCPIPDTDGDGVNDEEDKCINEKGPASNFGCPSIKINNNWKFTAKQKVTVIRSNDEAAPRPEKMLKTTLNQQRIIYTKGIENLIEKLNPGYKQKLLTQAETELVLPTFPEIEPEQVQELQAEFEKGNELDSVGSLLFNDHSRLAAKLFNTTAGLIADSMVRNRFYAVKDLLETNAKSTGKLLKKYQADMLNPALSDFYEYYLDLAVNNKLDKLDTAYFSEFYNQISETFAVGTNMQPNSDSSSIKGPSAAMLFDEAPVKIMDNSFEQADPRIPVYFYVFTPDKKAAKDSFMIYTLSESQHRRLLNDQLTFAKLDNNPAAKCPRLASPAGQFLDMSHPWHIVVVKVNKPGVIVASDTIIINVDRVLLKDDRIEQKYPYAVVMEIK